MIIEAMNIFEKSDSVLPKVNYDFEFLDCTQAL